MEPVNAATRQLTLLEPLELRHLPQEGLVFDEALPEAWLSKMLGPTTDTGEVIAIPGPGHAHLEVTPLGPVENRPPILVRGHFHATARTPCVRCLTDVDLTLEEAVETTLFPSAPAPEAGHVAHGKGAPKARPDDKKLEDWSDAELPELDELAEGVYTQDRVDLPGLLEEALLLAMDMNPSCADEPACDARTQALLDEANRPLREAEAQPDPRWAALHQLMEAEPKED
jgi:uncharacterized metal-binding protein YceD (DUF177 family)